MHRTTTKKYHLLCDGITQQRETEEFYDTEHKSPRSTSAQHKWKVWHSINQRTTQKEDKQKRINQLTTLRK